MRNPESRGRITGYQSADMEQVTADTVLTDPLTPRYAAMEDGNHEKTSTNEAKGKKSRPKTKLGIPGPRTLETRSPLAGLVLPTRSPDTPGKLPRTLIDLNSSMSASA